MNENFIHSEKCHSCSQSDFVKVLDLGVMPLANSFLKEEELANAEQKFPLVAYFCNNCGLLQLLDIVDPEILFREYSYLTSASRPLVDHFEKSGNNLVSRFVNSKDDLVVEIGGNDAVLLDAIKGRCRVLNIEPARNVAEISKGKGVETISEFFNKELAEKIVKEYGNAKIIIANNVMAHTAEIKSVFDGAKTLIGDDGAFVFEVHWVGNLLGEGGFDQIYHEHIFYHSLFALNNLVKQFGLNIFDVELIPIHGQSMRVYVGKNKPIENSVSEFLKKEEQMALDKAETFLKFSDKVENTKNQLVSLLKELKSQNKKVVGYGAPAKGNTLLNYFEITPDLIDYVIDTTPLKQGMYTPGTHIPIHSPEKMKEEIPDYILLLAWNYADAIIKKEKDLADKGVKFIVPVPFVRVI